MLLIDQNGAPRQARQLLKTINHNIRIYQVFFQPVTLAESVLFFKNCIVSKTVSIRDKIYLKKHMQQTNAGNWSEIN
jgi:hypothetical protein